MERYFTDLSFHSEGATLSASPLSAHLMSGGLSMQKQSWWYLSPPVLQRWIRIASSSLTGKCCILGLSGSRQIPTCTSSMWPYFNLHPLLKSINKSVEGKWFQDKYTVWICYCSKVNPLSSGCLSFTWFDKRITATVTMFVVAAELFFLKFHRWFCHFSFILQKRIKEEKQTVCPLWATVETHAGEPFQYVTRQHVNTAITIKLIFLCINIKYWISNKI